MIKIEIPSTEANQPVLLIEECITKGRVAISIGESFTRVDVKDLKKAVEALEK